MNQINSTVTISAPAGDVTIGNDKPFMLFAGPCQMESRDHALE
ncbi:3-deoxy-8-phosphooctulonate synthase, partial [Parvularcula sp. ZS-1/3]|nr:3-deoxy-8-phosphooctulonate synthase [Parvularcula mediterranea]